MELTKEYFDQQLGNLVRKEDLAQLADKTDLEQLKDDVRTVKTGITEIKESLEKLNKRDKEDSNAFAKSLVAHDKRLDDLETDVKNLRLKQA